MVAEGVALCETCAGETTNECHDNDDGGPLLGVRGALSANLTSNDLNFGKWRPI